MKVGQIMNRNVKTCRPQDSLNKAAQIMWEGLAGLFLLSLDDLACEAVRTLRGGVNDKLRNLVLEVHLAIHHGRVRLHPVA
jgi:hypothetical protein